MTRRKIVLETVSENIILTSLFLKMKNDPKSDVFPLYFPTATAKTARQRQVKAEARQSRR
jgi:hypothetical protein